MNESLWPAALPVTESGDLWQGTSNTTGGARVPCSGGAQLAAISKLQQRRRRLLLWRTTLATVSNTPVIAAPHTPHLHAGWHGSPCTFLVNRIKLA
ncbi:hypothetical protein INR49_016226 [Caranx melampygus]|nr:hypothetical protein INR49_016226 [Caranx melampygus]